MTLVPERMRETLAVMGLYQALGVDTNDIYFMPEQAPDGSWYPTVVAQLPSGQQPGWAIPIFGTLESRDELIAEYTEAAEAWNLLPNEMRRQWITGSKARLVAVNFLAKCAERGIYFPGEIV